MEELFTSVDQTAQECITNFNNRSDSKIDQIIYILRNFRTLVNRGITRHVTGKYYFNENGSRYVLYYTDLKVENHNVIRLLKVGCIADYSKVTSKEELQIIEAFCIRTGMPILSLIPKSIHSVELIQTISEKKPFWWFTDTPDFPHTVSELHKQNSFQLLFEYLGLKFVSMIFSFDQSSIKIVPDEILYNLEYLKLICYPKLHPRKLNWNESKKLDFETYKELLLINPNLAYIFEPLNPENLDWIIDNIDNIFYANNYLMKLYYDNIMLPKLVEKAYFMIHHPRCFAELDHIVERVITNYIKLPKIIKNNNGHIIEGALKCLKYESLKNFIKSDDNIFKLCVNFEITTNEILAEYGIISEKRAILFCKLVYRQPKKKMTIDKILISALLDHLTADDIELHTDRIIKKEIISYLLKSNMKSATN